MARPDAVEPAVSLRGEDILASGCRAIGGRKPDKRCTAKPESVMKVERLEPTHPLAKVRVEMGDIPRGKYTGRRVA